MAYKNTGGGTQQGLGKKSKKAKKKASRHRDTPAGAGGTKIEAHKKKFLKLKKSLRAKGKTLTKHGYCQGGEIERRAQCLPAVKAEGGLESRQLSVKKTTI